MPTIDEVAVALRESLTGTAPNQGIDLAAAARAKAPLAELTPVLARLGIVGAESSYALSGVTLSEPRGTVLLKGTGSFALPWKGAPSVPVAATLTCTASGPSAVAFTLELRITQAGWTFAGTFPVATLPRTLTLPPESGLTWTESFLATTSVDQPALLAVAAGLTFTGFLQQSGPLADYGVWVPGWPLKIEGSIVLPSSATGQLELDLRPAATTTLEIGPLTVRGVGFGLWAGPNAEAAEWEDATFSELDLVGGVELGGTTADLRAPLLGAGGSYRLMGMFGPKGLSLSGGLTAIASLFEVDAGNLSLPPGITALDAFSLLSVEAWFGDDPTPGSFLPRLEAAAVTLGSPEGWEWDPPIPLIKVREVATRWILTRVPIGDETVTAISGGVSAGLVLGKGAEPPVIDLAATLPYFVLTGSLREETPIPIGQAFREFFGGTAPATPGGMEITRMNLLADPNQQAFSGNAVITMDWPLPFFNELALTELGFHVEALQSRVGGGVSGRIQLGKEIGNASLLVRADYPLGREQGGWIFAGQLDNPQEATAASIVKAFIGIDFAFLHSVVLRRLEAEVDTGGDDPESGSWKMGAALAGAWSPEVLGQKVTIKAGAELDLARTAPTADVTGRIAGSFSINRLALTLSGDIGVKEPIYALKVEFDELWLQVTTGWRGKEGERHQIATIQLSEFTLGKLLETIVNLAAPTLGFTLDPPWDVLNRLTLPSLTVTIDPTEKSIELTCAIETDLLVMSIDSVGVVYKLEEGSSVDLVLTGRFLDRKFTRDDPLAWDVVNDPPPAVPGQGEKLIDLRYLALGQRIRFPGEQPETVLAAIEALRRDMNPPRDPQANPIEQSAMQFDPASQLLVGLDVSVMETLDAALVFNDPRVYGLSIGLRGDRAGPLAGLRFEILYRRLAGGIGMFRIELQLPETFRHIELGEVSITLGIIVVEVYTNGGFKVDLGFPYERNFSRSFTVQVFPFIGRGGIYFGVLKGGTSRQVPAIANGTFSPVVELGIGLAVGVGKEVSAGPLSGGVYVELEAIFAGVLGWFNPSAEGAAVVRYHRAQGMVALHGKLYAEVDFVVVKASVTLDAYAQVSATFEVYKATRFDLAVRVEAHAEVEVLWWTVSFSFNLSLDVGFTVGEDEPTPWILAAGPPAPGAAHVLRRAPRRLLAAQMGEAAAASFDWTARKVLSDGPRPVKLAMAPAFSLAAPPLAWDGVEPKNPNPDWRVALLLVAENGAAPGARMVQAPAFDPATPTPAASLVQCLLLWAIGSLHDGGEAEKVTAGELRLIAAELAEPAVVDAAFRFKNLTALLQANFALTIASEKGQPGAMALPPLPYLKLKAEPGDSHDLSQVNPVSDEYARQIAEYMAEFSPAGDGSSGAGGAAIAEGDPEEPVSFATFAFRDWCRLVTRAAVQEAIDALALVELAADPAKSLDELAATLPNDRVSYTVRAGDTVASVADYLGAGVAELEALNPDLEEELREATPGTQVTVLVGVTGATLARENPTAPLAAGSSVTLPELRLQVRSGDTLDSISAGVYGSADAPRLVAAAELAEDISLLAGGATAQVPERQAPLPGTPSPDLLAATFYVRYFDDTGAPETDWYARAIAEIGENQKILAPLEPGQTIPAGKTLAVPAAPQSTETVSYTTVAGDTLLRIGATLSLAQNPSGYTRPAWVTFREAVLKGGGTTVPATAVAIGAGESLAALLGRLAFAEGPATAVPSWLSGAAVLAPLATLKVAEAPMPASRYPTLADIARAAGITIAELAAQPAVTGTAGARFAAGTLTVSHQPVAMVGSLAEEVCGGAAMGRISSQVSRHLLAGARLPMPEAPKTWAGLAELAGVEFPSPKLDGTTSLALTIEKSMADLEWLQLAPSLGFTFTNAELKAQYPAAGLAVEPHEGPAAIPLGEAVPVTHGLDHRTVLQAAVPLAIPSADPALTPSLWRFPPGLPAEGADALPSYGLYLAGQGETVAEHVAITASTFGTLLPFTVRRVPGAAGVYELVGAAVEDRSLLFELARYVEKDTPTEKTALYLGVAPTPGMTDPTGLAVLDTAATGTFALRTNMATDVALSEAPALRHATFAEAFGFTQLLWQASVAEAGYQLTFATGGPGGGDLPAGAFAADGTATLWLLAIPREQQAEAPEEGRPMLAIDNCALVAGGLDASAASIYMEAAKATEVAGEHILQALVPPGSVGVDLTLPRPPAPTPSEDAGDEASQQALARLFSLLNARVGGDYPHQFTAPAAPPQSSDGSGLPLWRRQRMLRAAAAEGGRAVGDPNPPEYWRYQQVFPVTRWSTSSEVPAIPNLPPPAADPYAGFGGGSGLAKASFTFGFGDLLGHATAEGEEKGVDAEVGYTDPLLGPGTWPGTTSSYGVTAEGGQVTLAIAVGSQVGALAPGLTAAPAAARAAAGHQADRYREAYYQLCQPTVKVFSLTSLSLDGKGEPGEIPVSGGRVALWGFAAASWLYAEAIAALATPPLTGLATLGAVSERFGHSAAALAAVNGEVALKDIFAAGQKLKVEPDIVTILGDTAETVLARIKAPLQPPEDATALLVGNAAVPLRPATVLATASAVKVVLGSEPAKLTLATVAAENHTTPGQFALDTAEQSILRPGFRFESQEHEVLTSAEVAGFGAVRAAFAAMGVEVSLPALAEAAQEEEGLFADGAEPTIGHLVAAAGSTLASLAPGGVVKAFAGANVAVANLFEAGTALGLPTIEQPVPGDERTLAELAAACSSTATRLLGANLGLTLAAEAAEELLLPGAMLPPAPATTVPYGVLLGDSLAAVAALFGLEVGPFAVANALVPGLLAPKRKVSVTKGGKTYEEETLEGDSLEALRLRFDKQSSAIELADVVAAIATDTAAPAAGALLLAPAPALARRPGQPGSGPLTQPEAQHAYGADPAAFAAANAAVVGLLAPGITLSAPTPESGSTPTQRTCPADSFNAVLGRFAAEGVELTLEELLAANEAVALYALGTRVLLPPPPARMEASLGAGTGPFPQAAFPLTVTLRLQRTEAVVHPDLREAGEGPVERNETPVPAPAAPSQGQHSQVFDKFVEDFLEAFPRLRLGTAKVAGEPADLWAVDFDSEGIAKVEVVPGVSYPESAETVLGPRYFALRPPYPALQSRVGVEVEPVTDEGKLGKAVPTDFQGADVEVWARRFLADLDLFLGAPYASAIQTFAAADLDRLLKARWTLSRGVAAGLAPVLVISGDGKVTEGREAAVEDFTRLCGAGLAAAYGVSTVLQFDTKVTAGAGVGKARLSGAAQRPAGGDTEAAWSLGGARTALDRANSFVGFPLTLPDPQHAEQVQTGPLEYVYDSLEFDIATATGGEGYELADWVSFVQPLTGTYRPDGVTGVLGPASVPIPLRTHPEAPVVVGQSAEATYAGVEEPSLDQLALWTYGIAWSHEHAAQDEVLMTVTFNVDRRHLARGDGGEDLAADLFAYAANADRLRELMSWYVEPPANASAASVEAVRRNIAGSVATLGTAIASSWEAHWAAAEVQAEPRPPLGTAGLDSYSLRLKAVPYTPLPGGEPLLEYLQATLDGVAGPGPTGEWPKAECLVEGKWVELKPTQEPPPGATTIQYAPPPGAQIPIGERQTFRLGWTDLNVAQVENGQATLAVHRNEHLVEGVPTNAAFVMSTAETKAADVAVPLIEWSRELPLAGGGLAASIEAALTTLFGAASERPLTTALDYGYKLVPPAEGEPRGGLTTFLPVALYPSRPLEPAAVAAALAAAATKWNGEHHPEPTGGEWSISLTLSSTLEPSSRPLLVLEHLLVPLST